MKFGTWTFDGNLVSLNHISMNNLTHEKLNNEISKLYTIETGIDMSDYYQSVEWDVLSIPAQKNIKYYDCCVEPYYDIYFNITIRRKTLFYTVNLLIPCVNISFLSVLVFYLPSDSGEKLTLGISILVALLVFYLLLIELIPPSSLVIPLLGKYLLFTLVLVNLSILLTIFILNLHHRRPSTHVMPLWMKKIFIDTLPKYLMIQRPIYNPEQKYGKFFISSSKTDAYTNTIGSAVQLKKLSSNKVKLITTNTNTTLNDRRSSSFSPYSKYPVSVQRALLGIDYIHSRIQNDNENRKEIDDWKYVAMVVLLFILIF